MIPGVPVGIPMRPSEGGQAFQINNIFLGGSPSLSWNLQYNMGNTLVLPADDGINTNYVIPFITQPFSYIDITTNSATPVKLIINNVPPNWWLVRNESPYKIIISPQINGVSSYQSINDKLINENSENFIAIMPGVPPLSNALTNPTGFQFT